MECENSLSEMVATLQSRKEALESKLREKNAELKSLCIQEAELTGVLPPEIPLEPGESPPIFRRRVGTAFTYPENLINKLKSTEQESLATLELECKIQTGITEAALSLANDGTISKSVRRKHLLVYQQSQRRLNELEARLNLLKHSNKVSHLKQRKKPRPPLDTESDCFDSTTQVGINLSPLRSTSHGYLYSQQVQGGTIGERSPSLRHSHTYNGFSKTQEIPINTLSYRQPTQCVINISSRQSIGHHQNQPMYFDNRMSQYGYEEKEKQAHWANENQWYNTTPAARYGLNNHVEEEQEKASRYRDKFGSLDRYRGGTTFSASNNLFDSGVLEPLHGSPINRLNIPPISSSHSVLLPNQTYPENSMIRTQSLGSVEHATIVGRKCQEKEWYETSLDVTSHPSPQQQQSYSSQQQPFPLPEQQAFSSTYCNSSLTPPVVSMPQQSHNKVDQTQLENNTNIATPQQLSFDTVVPFEIPKNHTVVQAGKWQPYREVTKPFEMADFYKYSTKFRKGLNSSSTTPQQKAVYQPLQPMTCQPVSIQASNTYMKKESNDITNYSQQHIQESYPDELLAWYQDQNTNQPRTATLL